jgi:hypothetical protein
LDGRPAVGDPFKSLRPRALIDRPADAGRLLGSSNSVEAELHHLDRMIASLDSSFASDS